MKAQIYLASSRLLGLLVLMIFPWILSAQIFLQLELPHEVEAIKYSEGSYIEFKTTEIKGWQTDRIVSIIPDGNSVLFENNLLSVKEITHVRLRKPVASGVGKLFIGFGTGWFLFGTLGYIFDGYRINTGDIIIGSVALGIGWVVHKVFSKRKIKLGTKYRLRIIDTRFQTNSTLPPIP